MNQQQIFDKIKDISFKDGSKLINIISNLVIKGSDIGFSIDITGKNYEEAQEVKRKANDKINEINNISKVTIVFTSDKNPEQKFSKTKVKYSIEGVKKIILIASGKGGVGKSTISSLIAEQLNLCGYRVGLVDADIYGPSIPQIFSLDKMPEIENDRMIPLISRNIQIISLGFLVPSNSAMVWRGPMASKTIYKLLSLTKWGNLDYLIIDMPPGTGDIHLSILENYHSDGVIIVTTPQKLARIDVIRSIDLYKKLNLPIIGIIENMSGALFKGDSGEYLAKEYNIPLICKIPLTPKFASSCDEGTSLINIFDIPNIKKFV